MKKQVRSQVFSQIARVKKSSRALENWFRKNYDNHTEKEMQDLQNRIQSLWSFRAELEYLMYGDQADDDCAKIWGN